MDETQVSPAPAPVEKYPELAALRATLEAEREQLRAQTAELRARRDALNEQVQPMLAEVRALTREIQLAEQPRLHAIENQIAAIARARGARGTRQAK